MGKVFGVQRIGNSVWRQSIGKGVMGAVKDIVNHSHTPLSSLLLSQNEAT